MNVLNHIINVNNKISDKYGDDRITVAAGLSTLATTVAIIKDINPLKKIGMVTSTVLLVSDITVREINYSNNTEGYKFYQSKKK